MINILFASSFVGMFGALYLDARSQKRSFSRSEVQFFIATSIAGIIATLVFSFGPNPTIMADAFNILLVLLFVNLTAFTMHTIQKIRRRRGEKL